MNKTEAHLTQTPLAKHWKSFGAENRHGFAVMLSSLISENSCGCGEYTDLYPLIDWARSIDFSVIQLLPLNDSGSDPSPYNALSSCALHPINLSLKHLPLLSERLKRKLRGFTRLNTTARIHYAKLLKDKTKFLMDYVEETKTHFRTLPDYQAFVSSQQWLKPYALFKWLKWRFNGLNWSSWPEEFQEVSTTRAKKLIEENHEALEYHYIIQYLCYTQLKGAFAYATSKGIILKGDIPILISPDSADVWYHRSLFDLSLAAGAPPDAFNEDWQYWGFPVYNWPEHEKEHFQYWKMRLQFASNFYAAYRIDHVVGFFRIWAVERGEHPKYGGYIPTTNDLMLAQGRKILEEIISASSMLPIAEDLGVVPQSVKDVLTSLGMPGTKVFRWEKTAKNYYIPFEEYPALSLSTVSTHDTTTLELWWREEMLEAQRFARQFGWQYRSVMTIGQRKQLLALSHHSGSLFHINLLQEYLSLHSELAWSNPEDERINIPGYILPSNWTYKYPVSIETFTTHKGLKKTLQELIDGSG